MNDIYQQIPNCDRTQEQVFYYCTKNNLASIPYGSLGAHPYDLKNEQL